MTGSGNANLRCRGDISPLVPVLSRARQNPGRHGYLTRLGNVNVHYLFLLGTFMGSKNDVIVSRHASRIFDGLSNNWCIRGKGYTTYRRRVRRPVSRVLSCPFEADMDDHSSGTPVARRLARPTRMTARKTRPPDASGTGSSRLSSLLGLAPGGVYHAVPVAGPAVRSYRTLSPLPAGLKPKLKAGRRFALCGTFPGVAPAGHYPAPCLPWSPDFPLPAR